MNNTPIIKHYQKRSVIIEAAKFPATPAESMEVTDWLNDNGYPWLIGNALRPETLRYTRDEDDHEIPERGIYIDPADGSLMIRTLEGDMKVTPGDYIIRGVAGEFYPCKPNIFAKTYEEVIPTAEVIRVTESVRMTRSVRTIDGVTILEVTILEAPFYATRMDHDGGYYYYAACHLIDPNIINSWDDIDTGDRDNEPEKIEFEH